MISPSISPLPGARHSVRAPVPPPIPFVTASLVAIRKLPLFVVMTKSDVAGSVSQGMATASMTSAATPSGAPAIGTPATRTAMELAFQGLERVLWASMGRRPQLVRGVEQAQAAAAAIRGGGRGYVRFHGGRGTWDRRFSGV